MKRCVCFSQVLCLIVVSFSFWGLLGLKPQVTGLWREAAVDCAVEQGHGLPPLEVKVGDRLFSSFRNAHLNVCFAFSPSVLSLELRHIG